MPIAVPKTVPIAIDEGEVGDSRGIREVLFLGVVLEHILQGI